MYGLNHEVLYTAVKLIDLYLMKNETLQNKFQLLASGALLLASKIDVSKDICKSSFYTYNFIIMYSFCFLYRRGGSQVSHMI